MIRNQWYVVLESGQVKNNPVGVTRLGEKLVFWRDAAGKVNCLPDQCAHRGVALSGGKVLSNGELQCPFHGFAYDCSGRVTVIPANGRQAPVPAAFHLRGYPTYEAHGFIWIWWGVSPPEALAPPRFFDDLDAAFVYHTAYDPWQTHYARVIENQLDVVHLPFVHASSIGRGNRTLVNGPAVRWLDDDRFRVYVNNVVDNGQQPRKPSDLEQGPLDSTFWLEFIFPNLWENHISEQVRIVAAFVPVDEVHTLLYLRFYQKFLTLPGLGKLAAWIAAPFNVIVAHQDRRVVQTHRVPASSLRGGEQLIQGDRPIVEYRRRRAALQEQAGQKL